MQDTLNLEIAQLEHQLRMLEPELDWGIDDHQHREKLSLSHVEIQLWLGYVSVEPLRGLGPMVNPA